MTIFQVLERFRTVPVRMAMVVNEYGSLEGIVTQTDLLAAIAGHMPEVEGEAPAIVERADGTFLIDGATPVREAFERLGLRPRASGAYHTMAGFALRRFRHLPMAVEHFDYEGLHFEIVDMDGPRIDKLMVSRHPATREGLIR
jgi:CBS domain containing-hemolysin-like protein